MFLPGICSHCGTPNRLVDEWDAFAHGRRRFCLTCGFTLYWLNRNGTRYRAPEWTNEERAHIEMRTDGAALAGIYSDTLTDAERAMLTLAAQGLTNEQIVAKTGRALGTVKNLLSLAFAKLDANTRGEAVATAVRMGVIPCPYCGGE